MPLFAALDRLKADLDALRPLAPEQEQRVLQNLRLNEAIFMTFAHVSQ